MSDDAGEQQELTEVTERPTRSWHERTLTLYNSDEFQEIAMGYWLKLAAESFIIVVPLMFLIVVPGFALAALNIGPVTPLRVLGAWTGISTSLVLASWCFTEAVVNTESTDDEDADEG